MSKPTKWSVCPVNTQISLGLRSVWSESSLSAWWKLGSLPTHWVHSEDWSDWTDAQADLSLRWAHSHFVGFVMRWLNYKQMDGWIAVTPILCHTEGGATRTPVSGYDNHNLYLPKSTFQAGCFDGFKPFASNLILWEMLSRYPANLVRLCLLHMRHLLEGVFFCVAPRYETTSYKYYLIIIQYFFRPKMCHKNFENRLTNRNLTSKNVFE